MWQVTCMEGNTSGTCPHASSQHPVTAPHPGMIFPSPVPLAVDAGAIINPAIDDSVIDPATSIRMGCITYDRNENGYNLEWESRDNFDRWFRPSSATANVAHGPELFQHSFFAVIWAWTELELRFCQHSFFAEITVNWAQTLIMWLQSAIATPLILTVTHGLRVSL